MGGYEQIGMLIHSDHSCDETESYIEYYSQAVFDQFNDNSCIALNSVDKVMVSFSHSHDIIVNLLIYRLLAWGHFCNGFNDIFIFQSSCI